MAARGSILPGFGLSLGFSLLYLSLLVLIPLGALVLKSAHLSPGEFWAVVSSPRVVASLQLSFGAAAIASLINVPFGLLLAWVLVRYDFPGKRLVDALIDLPFALPTAVAGITLTTLLAKNGWIGSLLEPIGIKVAYTQLGVGVALVFIGIPFVVRTVQPVLEELGHEVEEAALTLGASGWQTFQRVVFPLLIPALITGFSLAFARTIGEYGSVVFISGNLPFKTEIAPLLIVTKLQQFDYAGAAAIGVTMLAISLVLLLAINLVQARVARRLGE
ncbi:MAG: sulfate ABC transporter permease subunit CysT [Meiothermus sp.]